MTRRSAGTAWIGPHVVFGPGVSLGEDVEIRPFCHLEGCTIESGARIGPHARLRPGAAIATGARIGNFVEVKASRVGAGAAVGHLSYVGDSGYRRRQQYRRGNGHLQL